jgi:hypothetical protein
MAAPSRRREKGNAMLSTMAVILLVSWVLGLVGGYSMGGLSQLLLVSAMVVVLFKLHQGRRQMIRCREESDSRRDQP